MLLRLLESHEVLLKYCQYHHHRCKVVVRGHNWEQEETTVTKIKVRSMDSIQIMQYSGSWRK